MSNWEKFRKGLRRLKPHAEERFTKRQTTFLPEEVAVTETPPPYAGRIIIWTIVIFVAVIFMWMIFGTVDEVAVTSGKMIPDGYVRTLQAEDKGIIQKICVSEGQFVHAGDVLMELDPTMSEADLAKIKQTAAHSRLEIARLTAERDGSPFEPEKVEGADADDIANEKNLYQSRLGEHKTLLMAAKALVNQGQSSLRGAQIASAKDGELYRIEADKENRYEMLSEANAIAQITYLDQQAKRISAENAYYEQQQTVGEQSAALDKAQSDYDRIAAEWLLDINTNLTKAQQELAAAEEELKKADEKNRLIQIVAPDDGYVSNLTVHTVGGVVTAAQPLVEIVPRDTPLKLEAWAENKDIGFLHEGQTAQVKVETFEFQKYGTIPAKVVNISPNSVDDPDKGRVYRLILEPEADTIKVDDEEVPLLSGMNVTAEIKTRSKHIYEYFLEPFRKYKSEFLRERA